MIRRILATTALAGAVATAAATAAGAQDSPDPIRLTLNDWTGQLITTRIMGEVLEKAGLNVEYVPADYLAQFAGLKTGDLHVAMEIWETTGRGANPSAGYGRAAGDSERGGQGTACQHRPDTRDGQRADANQEADNTAEEAAAHGAGSSTAGDVRPGVLDQLALLRPVAHRDAYVARGEARGADGGGRLRSGQDRAPHFLRLAEAGRLS